MKLISTYREFARLLERRQVTTEWTLITFCSFAVLMALAFGRWWP